MNPVDGSREHSHVTVSKVNESDQLHASTETPRRTLKLRATRVQSAPHAADVADTSSATTTRNEDVSAIPSGRLRFTFRDRSTMESSSSQSLSSSATTQATGNVVDSMDQHRAREQPLPPPIQDTKETGTNSDHIPRVSSADVQPCDSGNGTECVPNSIVECTHNVARAPSSLGEAREPPSQQVPCPQSSVADAECGKSLALHENESVTHSSTTLKKVDSGIHAEPVEDKAEPAPPEESGVLHATPATHSVPHAPGSDAKVQNLPYENRPVNEVTSSNGLAVSSNAEQNEAKTPHSSRGATPPMAPGVDTTSRGEASDEEPHALALGNEVSQLAAVSDAMRAERNGVDTSDAHVVAKSASCVDPPHDPDDNETHEVAEQRSASPLPKPVQGKAMESVPNPPPLTPDVSTKNSALPFQNPLRSSWEFASQTPTPSTTVSSCTHTPVPPRRMHSKVNVPLPTVPTPIDFSDISDTVGKKYKIGRKIGEGTYGEVYIGEHRLTKKTVALKRLKVLQGLEGFPLTSLREITALKHIARQQAKMRAARADMDTGVDVSMGGSLAARNASTPLSEVTGLDDVLLSDNSRDIFLVFEYVSCSLAGLLHRSFPFTEHEIAYVFRRIFHATSTLHAMKIIHRDIKADNVLIGDDGSVRLCDFGLCVFEGSGRNAKTPSLINLSYRPPEMLLGSVDYDEKVDIWSLGCFLAQMYLRRPPFAQPQSQADRKNPREQRSTRGAETELGQLRLITDVLGPLYTAGPDAFPEGVCRHLPRVIELRAAVGASPSAAAFSSFFSPSLIYQQFNSFSPWCCAVLENLRHANPHRTSGLTPSLECQQVLNAIFQLDPRKRPSASELLQFPFFTTFLGLPRDGETRGSMSSTSRSEEYVRTNFVAKLKSFSNSHSGIPGKPPNHPQQQQQQQQQYQQRGQPYRGDSRMSTRQLSQQQQMGASFQGRDTYPHPTNDAHLRHR